MKDLLAGVVADLREKRLLPVAILLLAGLVAVPVLLAKPAEDKSASSTPDPAAASQTEAARALVALADDESGASSTLKLFDPRNPFAPEGVKNLKPVSSSSLSDASTQLAEAGGDAGAGGGESSGGGGGGGSTDTGSTGGGTIGGGTPGGGSPGGGGGGTEVTNYTYVLDVTFSRDGRTKKYSGMSKLTQLPSEDNPLLLFLGVDAGGDNAVFLVDSTLKTEGEGNCSPSEDDCATLSISPGDVQRFSDEDGRSYVLRIDEIRKVKVEKAAASGARARSASSDTPEDSDAADVRRFTPPILTDLVSVASQPAGDSSTDQDRR